MTRSALANPDGGVIHLPDGGIIQIPDAGVTDGGAGGADGGGFAVADGGTPGAVLSDWCGDTETYQCMYSPLLMFDKTIPAPFQTHFDTGFVPSGSPLQLQFILDIPAYTRVRMGGRLRSYWPDSITHTAVPARKTGVVDFDYGIETHINMAIHVGVLGVDYDWEGELFPAQQINFHVKDTMGFDPWAFSPGVTANGFTPELQLIELSLLSLIGIPSWLAGGGFKLSVQGELQVHYETEKVVISNVDQPQLSDDGTTKEPWQNGAWTEHYVHPEGKVNYTGVIHFIPSLYIEVLGVSFDYDLADIPFGLDLAETPWVFDDQLVHVPLPDVRAPEPAAVDFGQVEVGQVKLLEVELPNIGEADGYLQAAVDNAAFEVLEASPTAKPGHSATIPVAFTPQEKGFIAGDLVVMTNDPDSPEIHITLNAQGIPFQTDPDDPDEEPDAGGKDAGVTNSDLPGISGIIQDGSCGCRTAGSSTPSGLALGGFGLGMIALRLRRLRKPALASLRKKDRLHLSRRFYWFVRASRTHSSSLFTVLREERPIMIRRPSLSHLPLFAVALFGVLTPSSARADLPQPCDQTTYYCANTSTPEVTPTGPLSLSSNFSNLDLSNGLDTGWLPKCDNNQDHCDNQSAQFRFQADLSDTKIDLKMLGDTDVYWGADNGVEPGNLKVCPRATQNGGSFSGTFTMSPTIGFYLDVGFTNPFEFNIDPFELSGLLGGDEFVPAQFDFAAAGDTQFTPWAYDPGVSVPLDGPLQPIFTVPISELADSIFDTGGSVSATLDMSINLVGGTTNTQFKWVTTKMVLASGGHTYDVTPAEPCVTIPFAGGNDIKITSKVLGTFSYSGNTSLQPQIKINSVAGFQINFAYNIDVNADLPFGSQISDLSVPQGAAVPKTYPMPNLFVQSGDSIDFGKVEVGATKTKTVSLSNTGHMIVVGDTLASDPDQFSLSSDSNGDTSFQIDTDGGTDKINITFTAKTEGAISETLTINSNDPDLPTTTITLKATGKITDGTAGSGGTGGDSAGGSAGSSGSNDANNDGIVTQDGGCCRVAGPGESKESEQKAAALGLLGVALVVARRRRRA
ncbi:MAG: choice-of-anchor D domain-containing protein [Polyangiaceae bacterium]